MGRDIHRAPSQKENSMIPIEWLRALREHNGYERLIEQAGSLSVAAWRLATAKRQVWETPTEVPTARELRAAARELVKCTEQDSAISSGTELASECESAGLHVIH